MKYWVAAVAGVLFVAGQANAATVTREFTLTASSFVNFFNEPAPFTSLTGTFRLTYDDAGNSFSGTPDSIAIVTDGRTNAGPFSAAASFGYFQASPPMVLNPRLGVGGAVNGTNVSLNGTDDFYFVFDAGATGPTRAMLGFTTAGGRVGFTATDAIVTPVQATAAVPEASTWAMMIAGFGMIGGLSRRRRIAKPALA